MGRLTARGIASIKKPGRHADGGNLYLSVSSAGTKSWTFMWSRGKKQKEMGLGPYPRVGLAEARSRAEEAHRQICNGIDPVAEKRRSKGLTFGDVADRFIKERVALFKNKAHRRQWVRSLTELARPIRGVPIADMDTNHVLSVVEPVWRTRWPTGKKLRIHIAKVLDFAKPLDLRDGPNPAAWAGNLALVLPDRETPEKHWPAMGWRDVPAFVEKLRQRPAIAARLTEFVVLTACRSDEARAMTFAEVNRSESLWVIPPERTKTGKKSGRPTRIPLSSRALEILDEAALRGDGFPDSLCFPSPRGKKLSDQAAAQLMERMGVNGACLHGFRTSLSTWAHDMTDHAHEVIEEALAHSVGTSVSRAYNRGDQLEKRRALMSDWGKYCGSRSG